MASDLILNRYKFEIMIHGFRLWVYVLNTSYNQPPSCIKNQIYCVRAQMVKNCENLTSYFFIIFFKIFKYFFNYQPKIAQKTQNYPYKTKTWIFQISKFCWKCPPSKFSSLFQHVFYFGLTFYWSYIKCPTLIIEIAAKNLQYFECNSKK